MFDKIVKSKLFNSHEEIVAGVSPRLPNIKDDPFGFNLSFSVDENRERVTRNRIEFFSALGIDYQTQAAYQKQTHSDIVKIVEQSGYQGESDSMITDKNNIALAVSVADCVPVLIYDYVNKVIAAVHSGWRGTKKRILPKTLNVLENEFSCRSTSLLVYIGPSICRNHYEVKQDVAGLFPTEFVREKEGKFFLDVAGVNYSYLLEAGVPPKNIEQSQYCTYENLYLHSFRRDGEKSGRGFAVIMIKGGEAK